MRHLTGAFRATHAPNIGRWACISQQIARYSTSPLEWLASFTNYEKTGVPDAAGTDTADGFDLGRMRRLLEALGSPQEQWPAVHIAGTKGKGSTVAMLSSILTASGYRVGSYTSPHIVSLTERISIGSSHITEDALSYLIARHTPTIDAQQSKEGGALSHFEVLTALAYKHFQDESVDIAVIETGLGGGRDATNVLVPDKLQAAVITAVGMDHASALGGDIEGIALAKAGIMKAGRPVVLGRQPESMAEAVLLHHASELQCRTYRAHQDVHYDPGAIQISAPVPGDPSSPATVHQDSHVELSGEVAETFASSHPREENTSMEIEMCLGLVGEHQLDNAATAVTTAACLKRSGAFPNITLDTVKQGLEAARLLGRFQVGRLRSSEGDDTSRPTVILDGAHTPESAAALAKTVRAAFPDAPLALVIAMANDKDHRGVCAALRSMLPAVVMFTEVPVAGGKTRSAPPGVLAGAWQAAGMMMPGSARGRSRELIQASVKAAVAKAERELRAAQGPGIIVVCGSLHAVGAAIQDLELSTE